jgi:nitrate reductase delta subunit
VANILRTYKALSLLLSYPDEKLVSSLGTFIRVFKEEKLLPKKNIDALDGLMAWMNETDLLTLQEHYVTLFDQGRKLSLHLFEHVHGESRERGQAMIDLSEQYLKQGLDIDGSELPDYIPLFLEFLAILKPREAQKMLAEPCEILKALSLRLKKRDSLYHTIFDALIALSKTKMNFDFIKNMIAKESHKPMTCEELDKEWEEEAVTFMGGKDCSTCSPSSEPKVTGALAAYKGG